METSFLFHGFLTIGVALFFVAFWGGLLLLAFKLIRGLSPEQKLKRLASMRQSGLISEAEFEQAKGRVLSRV